MKRRWYLAWACCGLLVSGAGAQPAQPLSDALAAADLVCVGTPRLLGQSQAIETFTLDELEILAAVVDPGAAPWPVCTFVQDTSIHDAPRLDPGTRVIVLARRDLLSVNPTPGPLFIATRIFPGDASSAAVIASVLTLPAATTAPRDSGTPSRADLLAELVATAPEGMAAALAVDLVIASRIEPPRPALWSLLEERLAVAPAGGSLVYVLGPMLAWLGDDRAVDVMIERLARPSDVGIALPLRAALRTRQASLGQRAALQRLVAAPEATVRAGALGALAGSASPVDLPVVLEAASDTEAMVRAQAAMALAELPALDAEALAAALRLAADTEHDVQARALHALARHRRFDELRAFAAAADDEETRRLAARALRRPALLPR